MKKAVLFVMFFACYTMTVAAQGTIRVNYQGAKPTISDFITAYLAPTYGEDGEQDDEYRNGIRHAWECYRKGQPQDEGVTFTLDQKNGFACYEYREVEEGVEFIARIEMCYWNETDQKHKLFAYNYMCYDNGCYSPGQYDGLTFCRYDNATKTMRYTSDPGVDAARETTAPNVMVSFSLPRSGKDIVMTRWMPSGMKQTQTLKWNGHGFSAQDQEAETTKAFVEKFYNNWADQLDYVYLKRYATPRLLKYLADSYDYDCEGECLATWKFFYEGGGDVAGPQSRHITARDDSHVLVETKYENYEYAVLLTLVKNGNSYKIDELKQIRSVYSGEN